MKIKEIRPVLDALKTIKIAKIKDKSLVDRIVKIHIYLLGVKKQFDSDFDDLRTAFLSAYEDEQTVVLEIERKMQNEADPAKKEDLMEEIKSHQEYLDAVTRFNSQVDRMRDREFECGTIVAGELVEKYMLKEYDMALMEALSPLLEF